MRRSEESDRKLGFLTYDCLDEWLDGVNISLDGLADEMGGGWFNCLQALQTAGAQCVMYATSARVTKPTRIVHEPTGALICILPSTRFYRLLKSRASWLRASDGYKPTKFGGLFRRLFDMASGYTSLPVLAFYKELWRDGCNCLLVEQYGTPRFDICVLAARIRGVPVFGLFASQIAATRLWSRLIHPLRPLAYRFCNGFVIARSTEIDRLRAACSIPANRIAQIPYPVDTALWRAEDKTACRTSLGLNPDDRIAIWHGGIDVWVKGLDIMILAWNRLAVEKRAEKWKLLIVGGASADEAQKLNDLLAETRVSGVTFVDRWILDRSLIRRYLSAADVYVFPSRSDAFPISTLEAMACGCPPIISSGAGSSELLADGDAAGGLVVQSENIAALAAALERLLGDPKLSADLGRHARQTVEELASMQSVGRRMVDFLFQTVESTATGQSAQ